MKIVKIIEKYIIYIVYFLLPLLVLPIFDNIYETPKLVLLFTGATLILTIKLIKLLINKGLEFNSSKYDLPIVGFILVFLLSGVFASFNKFDSFFFPGTASFAILAGIYFFIVNQLSKEDKEHLLSVVIASGLVLAVIQIASFLGILKLVPQLPDFMKGDVFITFGSILNLIILLISLSPILIDRIVNKKVLADKILASIISFIFLISISTSIYLTMPGKSGSFTILNYKTSWPIAIDSLKTNPLLGVGPGNYNQAFSRFKPLEFNSTEGWNLKYLQGTGGFINIFTEIGLLGIIITLFIFAVFLKKMEFTKPLYVSLLIVLLGFLLLPLTSTFYPIMFLLLALNSNTKEGKIAFFIKRYAAIFLTVPVIMTMIVITYLFARASLAEFTFTKSVKAMYKGEGLPAYELINKTIQYNPYADRYHLFSSGINFAIAENIAKKEKLEDADKETISQLIQQAVTEGKAAVSVNIRKSSNWEALANIFQSIMAYAKGSDQFAIEALNQAIFLEPTNPLLRIKLGGIYYAMGNYETAIEAFKLAVLSKSDLANSHYNLAIAYRENKQIDKAKEQMEIVLKLVALDSDDYKLAKKELDELTINLNTPTKDDESLTQTENLTPPLASPAPEIVPQVELPVEPIDSTNE